MLTDKKVLLLLLGMVTSAATLQGTPLWGAGNEGYQTKAAQAPTAPIFAAMPAPGKKVSLGKDGYLIYGFDRKPAIGTVIVKVTAYTADGKKDSSLEILTDAGMPSMRGVHDTGERPCQLSRKGDYLIPITLVMPGEWELRLTVKKGGKVIFRGSHRFDV